MADRAIRLVGGRLDGTIHEVEAGWPVPDRFGLPVGEDKNDWEWYLVHPTERREGMRVAYADSKKEDPAWQNDRFST